MNKSCGSCYWFCKRKDLESAIGICEFYDGKLLKERKNCDDWKGIKYKRNNK